MSDRVKNFYERRQNEILTIVGLLVPLIISIISSIRVDQSFRSKLPYLILAVGYIVLSVRLIAIGRAKRFLKEKSLSQMHGPVSAAERYRGALDAAQSCYFFLGMSAEEFQREVPIHDYFRDRQTKGRSPLDVRVLLLHPDSPHFASKMHDVNRDADLRELIQRKKDVMRTLVHTFSTVPKSSGSFEVRFFDAPSIWSMQLYDCSSKGGGTPDSLRVMPQLPGRHGKYSHVYELDDSDEELFAPFRWYFEGMWEQALPLKPNGVFPDLYASSGSTVTTLAFDFDGTLVDSAAEKRGAFMHAMGAGDSAAQDACDAAYSKHGTKNRVELLRSSFADVHAREPSDDEVKSLADAYTNFFRTHLDDIELFQGFFDFYNRFRHRYRFIVVSNAPRDEIVEMCDKFGITDFFVRIYGHPVGKGVALREVFDEFGIEPAGVMYVGDRVEDGMVAESVGTRFCRLAPAGAPGTSSDPILKSLAELAGVLYDLDIGVDHSHGA